ncbi:MULTISPECIES: cell wall metabolism sensor histidine kinase WalK [Streptomyces]|uniref:sensor histidine kinase n=1 Tax=Streptomyces TaxID=1883 RepID=UPI000F738D57|nr:MULTISPECIES: ATP-binding protein [unclassified Streptomyces]NUV97650.1 HAMP domain-containing histidine kinase [Streptomyces sp. KAI 90]QCB24658.1 HAMP domain-containing histidine kinase [Streptomyces sp. SS52]RSS27586.1 sensor histidine kinase [Streptomyces sp. WAC08452]RSS69743.1 sensor histidine kinase [Streptomyces sp. WAC06273]
MSRLFGSVRARATLGATLVVAVALVAAGTAVLLSLRSNLLGEAGTQAERSARDVATELAVGTRYTELSLDVDDRPVQIVDEAGGLVAASEDLERITGTGVDAVEPRPAPTGTGDGDSDDDDDSGESLEAGEIGERTTVSDGTATIDGDTEDYRFAAVPVETRDGEQLTVWAGAPLSAEHGAVNTALTVMLIGFPLLLAVVAWVTWLVTGRALRPVEGIRREMAAITASEDLARRVPVPGTHDEVARLASTTNETLAALETSVERQRRFVADASHELRSPIASLRTQLEVAAAHPELLDLDGAVEDTVRLQRLAADLLLLARLDAGERPADARVDLAALAREEAGGRTGVRVRAEEGVTVAGSRGQLGRVLANLLDNAQRHARSAVEVAVRRDGGAVVVAVADDGEGVPAADRERIFERFVRLDAARSRDDGGAGLGLAIARDVAVRHGGTLTVHDAPAGGALFELRLPGVRADSV